MKKPKAKSDAPHGVMIQVGVASLAQLVTDRTMTSVLGVCRAEQLVTDLALQTQVDAAAEHKVCLTHN